MTDQPLHDFIDMEAYDVVPGEQYRSLAAELEMLREEKGLLAMAASGAEAELERVKAERDEARQLYIDDECPSREFLLARGWIAEIEGEAT